LRDSGVEARECVDDPLRRGPDPRSESLLDCGGLGASNVGEELSDGVVFDRTFVGGEDQHAECGASDRVIWSTVARSMGVACVASVRVFAQGAYRGPP
jgi:hypothetical protein